VPAASRYDAKSRTRTQICGADVTLLSIEVPRRFIPTWNLVERGSCHTIAPGGVLLVSEDDVREPHVLKIDEMPLSRPSGLSGAAQPTRFDALFEKFYPDLFGLVYRVLGDRMETEDTLQEAFLKLSEDARLQARPDAEVAAWLRRVGLNLAFNRLRSARRARARLERVGRLERSDEDATGNERAGPAGVVVRHEEQAAVRRALADVPERQRECLLLRHSGYSYAEIAETVGVAVGSVGVLLARAEHAFRTIYRRQTES
jgi:RNA polymerase sigma factor (sigma-70 family)